MAKESICSAGFSLHYHQSGVFVPSWEFKPGFGSSLKTLILKVNLLRLKSVKLLCFLGVSMSQKKGGGNENWKILNILYEGNNLMHPLNFHL